MGFARLLRHLNVCSLNVVLLLLAVSGVAQGQVANDQRSAYFEKYVRPLLVDRCQSCHGSKKQWAELRLDTAAGLHDGGESGPAIVAGQPEQSELLHRVNESDDDLRMPPQESGPRLTPGEVEVLSRWIKSGAFWPQTSTPDSAESLRRAQRQHWAFQPVVRHNPPTVKQAQWCQNEVDSFILARLETAGLSHASVADRRTLIRRATYDLTGLPPTTDEVKAFEQDRSDDAYQRLIDRLLRSPRYGEQWGRHWLDVARYSDVKGYVYGREERRFVHASLYRDWVIQAFNNDLPYNRFVLLQLAADQVVADDSPDLAAMGYLTLGRRFLGVTPDIIDDRIDVVGRGLLGLSISCARCHDHKYDPIPTADYYSLYGVFENSTEDLVPIVPEPEQASPSVEFIQELQQRKQTLAQATAEQRQVAGERIREKIDRYLLAQLDLEKYPALTFGQLLPPDAVFPSNVWRWESFLSHVRQQHDPVFQPWIAFADLADEEFSSRAQGVTQQLAKQADSLNPRVAAAFSESPVSPVDVAKRYQQVFGAIDKQWIKQCTDAESAGEPAPTALPDPDDEALRQVLYGSGSPCVIPDVPIVNSEYFWDIKTTERLWKLQKAVDQQILKSPHAAPHAVVLNDRPSISEPRVFRRGDPTKAGEAVPRQFLEILAGSNRQPFQSGSGRLEMARAIVDPSNPLTARVWVNRVWRHHFGTGLVPSPSDFGLRSDPPSHPELLDWLTSAFIANGWSTKWLHRTIMLSATYQQSSRLPSDQSLVAKVMKRDPRNRLLSRMNSRRLTYEQFRDTLLALSGEFDLTMGGQSVAMFGSGQTSNRRSVYGWIDREFLPPVLRVYDFANPELHTSKRSETTAPQQALFAMNGDLLVGRARSLIKRAGFLRQPLSAERVQRLYQIVFQRDPSSTELRRAMEFLQPVVDDVSIVRKEAVPSAWSYGVGEIDPDARTLKSFNALPHFTGDAWQGGSAWPDSMLGWAQLTADGGHPGNHHQHAVVRRWTAPRSGVVSITSELIHEPARGNGIRYWVLSSRSGVLRTGLIHESRKPVRVDRVKVQLGEMLDFIVDVNGHLGYDQFLWAPEIRLVDPVTLADDKQPSRWHARDDFTSQQEARQIESLALWEQFAQVLLMSNELMFVD
ncbi:Planctomycete cytochrome C [Stieleria bergensis]|uniref:Planctomycete cytochrome C n=1 Tax=Stieleria bergensis TaxID=2528025 RepID=A0A517T2Q4_9BACT|nr:Planctomycete cytochrome C [Planctomycetes bacterium SV_7m_r]